MWMAIAMVITAFLIFKYEGFRRKRSGEGGEKEWSGNVYEDETWRPCLRNIHPAWLLAFRAVAFFVLLIMLIVIGLVDGPTIFFYYTQWTFALITLYFGLVISMHSLNAIFLLGDAALNSLSFPCFRIAYFFLWTIAYVLFQWTLHSLVHIWWPYPFLDLASHYAPLWYFSVAVMHLPCYGAFTLLVKLKHRLLQRWFPKSYQSSRIVLKPLGVDIESSKESPPIFYRHARLTSHDLRNIGPRSGEPWHRHYSKTEKTSSDETLRKRVQQDARVQAVPMRGGGGSDASPSFPARARSDLTQICSD
ncbi:hypothetical protein F2Q70_00000521 [Brassica cretica]|uniref:Transmembrane protein n=1 Tax=Brassica cretica TaxID=69181 RepID=A0A8S9IUV6_BRACR|nr:hypothetical protein F2Q70_00000521 [Brassica cretica]